MSQLVHASIGARARDSFTFIKRVVRTLAALKTIFNSYDRLRQNEKEVLEKTAVAARRINVIAHKSPWPYIGAAALVGVTTTLALRSIAKGGTNKT